MIGFFVALVNTSPGQSGSISDDRFGFEVWKNLMLPHGFAVGTISDFSAAKRKEKLQLPLVRNDNREF